MRSFILALVFLCAALPAFADTADIARALDMSRKREFAVATQILKPLADKGDSAAQYYLSNILEYGPKPDPAAALMWLRRAAESGFADAQTGLGDRFYDGRGVKQDYAAALIWYKRAAEKGNVSAQNTLGEMYELGRGASANASEAFKWYLMAASQGRPLAQVNVGRMYATGSGVTKDDAAAVKYFRLAADQKDAGAAMWMSSAYETGSGVTKDLTLAYMWTLLAQKNANLRSEGPNVSGFKVVLDNLRAQMSADAVILAQQMAIDWKPEGERN